MGFLLKSIFFLFPFLAVPLLAAELTTRVITVAAPRSFDSSLPKLKYATTDANKFTNALEKVGLVSKTSIIALDSPNRQKLRREFLNLQKNIDLQNSSKKVEKFYFYFSGHSDERGLHLSDGVISKDELHLLLSKVTSRSKVVFLDSCFSAALAPKGLKPAVKFTLPVATFDQPSGTVFITSSSVDTQSFESDELEGSVFSHYLIVMPTSESDKWPSRIYDKV